MGKIGGREATYVAIDGSKRAPICLEPPSDCLPAGAGFFIRSRLTTSVLATSHRKAT
jgi:hypothetical protein